MRWLTKLRRIIRPQAKTASIREKQIAESCSWFLPTK
jgi:hypothetical protein